MKRHTFILLLGWLLLLASNLMAQQKEGLFRLKEGDWFEVQVNDYQKYPCSDSSITSHLIRYQLVKTLSNSNQRYNVSIEHIKVWDHPSKRKFLGYDSYYPPFEENKATPAINNQFLLEVTPLGKIIRFIPSKDNKFSIAMLNEIGSLYGSKTFMMKEEDMRDSLTVHNLSSLLMLPLGHPDFNRQTGIYKYLTANIVNRFGDHMDGIMKAEVLFKDSLSVKIPYQKNTWVPLTIKLPDIQLILKNASFPIENNTVILGKLEDQPNKNIRIELIGNTFVFPFTDKKFKTQKDGSFNCSFFIERPLHLNIQIGNKNLISFMEPGDTLYFDEIKYLAHKLSPVKYNDTNQEKDLIDIKEKTRSYSGKAEYNTILSNEMRRYLNHSLIYKSHPSIIEFFKESDVKVNKLIDSYQGKASAVCIDYFRRNWNYYSIGEKLKFYEQSKIPTGKNTYKDVLTIKDFPADFFLGVDTLPIVMNPFEWNNSYLNFLSKAQKYKQERSGYAIGRSPFGNFVENYFFSRASLAGFPLYYQIARLIEREYIEGNTNEEYLEPYYNDFINNCRNPFLKELISSVHENAMSIKVGNIFPLKEFILSDSSTFKVEKLKGKPTCLIFLNTLHPNLYSYKNFIKKYENVQFLFVRQDSYYKYEDKIDSSILEMENVTFIDIEDSGLMDKLLLNAHKAFILDKWLRIVDNKAGNKLYFPNNKSNIELENYLQKAINAKRYSKAEQSAMLKTAGWSLGSILFTLLVGFGIYRIRIRRIKQQEEAKRRIKELEIKAIRSQMNPHFIFNALNSIQSLINGNQFKEANIYLSKFAILLRGVLNNSEKGMISLSDELKAVELYCQLEQLRFNFNFDITVAKDVNGDLIEIPGMIIQPLAENAVVHGISGKGDQGILDIQVIRQNEHICIEVSDNGKGYLPQENDSLRQKGFGLKLVEERINVLNLEGKEAKLTVRNIGNNSGTLASLIIPID